MEEINDQPQRLLRYIDFISSQEQTKRVMQYAEYLTNMRILPLTAPADQSGPKIEEAVSTFAEGRADFGRI
jgi:hypothetical protein